MARTPEGKVKDELKKQLREIGAFQVQVIQGVMSFGGISDSLVCYRGIFFALEVKADATRRGPTPLQMQFLDGVSAAGGISYVVDAHNVHDIGRLMKRVVDTILGEDWKGF